MSLILKSLLLLITTFVVHFFYACSLKKEQPGSGIIFCFTIITDLGENKIYKTYFSEIKMENMEDKHFPINMPICIFW